MSTLASIFEQIQVQKNYQNADTDMEIIHGKYPTSEQGRSVALQLAKRQAGDNIAQLQAQYNQLVYKNSVIILATGGTKEFREAFLREAAKAEALTVDADEYYKKVAGRAEEMMGRDRSFNGSACQEVVTCIAEAIKVYAPREWLDYPKFPSNFVDAVCQTPEQTVAIVKAAVKSAGIPVAMYYSLVNVAGAAFRAGFTQEPLPVIVSLPDAEDLPTWQGFMPDCTRVTFSLEGFKGTAEEAMQAAKAALVKKMGGDLTAPSADEKKKSDSKVESSENNQEQEENENV